MTVSFAARSEEQALRSLWIVRENIYVRVHVLHDMWVMYVSRLNECMLIILFFLNSIFFESLSSELYIASAVFGCNQLSFLAHVKHLKSGARKI